MMPMPLFAGAISNFIQANALFWHDATDDNYIRNLVTNTDLTQSSSFLNSPNNPTYTTSSNSGNKRRMDIIAEPGELGNAIFEMKTSAYSTSGSGLTVFQVKQNPGTSNSYYSSSFPRAEFLIGNEKTGPADIRGIRIPSPNTTASILEFEYRTNNNINTAQRITHKNANSTNYVPGQGGRYIDVVKIAKRPGNPDNGYPSVYATRNGRGSSGSPYHITGSFIQIQTHPAIVAGNLFRPVFLTGDNDSTWIRNLRLQECIVFDGALVQNDINAIETYLRQKWNISY
jgi:hypothetical protein